LNKLPPFNQIHNAPLPQSVLAPEYCTKLQSELSAPSRPARSRLATPWQTNSPETKAGISIYGSTSQNINTENSTLGMGNAVELRRVGGRKQAPNALPKGSPLALRFLTATVAANRDLRCALHRFEGLRTSSGERSSIDCCLPNDATNSPRFQLQLQLQLQLSTGGYALALSQLPVSGPAN
jgi:hypothetical protein